MEYIIKLTENNTGKVYRANFSGDPGRTYIKDYAKVYKTKEGAESALTQLRNRYNRTFINAEVLSLESA